jgi:phosphoribosylpyrophosphate synthetase
VRRVEQDQNVEASAASVIAVIPYLGYVRQDRRPRSARDVVRRLKSERRRVTEVRDIEKKPPRTLPRGKNEVCLHEGPCSVGKMSLHRRPLSIVSRRARVGCGGKIRELDFLAASAVEYEDL